MIKDLVKKIFQKAGVEIRSYSLATSEIARMKHLFNYHKIDLVFDVGANVGQYQKILRSLNYSGRIVSFEPLSSAYSKLQNLSRKDPLWEVAPRMALGNEEGEITINIANNSQSSSILSMLDSHVLAAPTSIYCASETVNLNRLGIVAKDYIRSDTKSIFLKIDVQGYEKQVIDGAIPILPLVKGLQVELSLVPLYKNELIFKEMLSFIEKLGYELHLIVPGFTDPNTGRMLQMDGIFFSN
jgi:FkbM family methyltransferase